MMINGRYHFKAVSKTKRTVLSYLNDTGWAMLYIRTGVLASW